MGVAKPNETELRLPNYGLRYPDYAAMSFVEVVLNPADQDPAILAFIGYGTVEAPFDRIHASLVDDTGNVLQQGLETVPASRARFRLRWRSAGQGLQVLDSLSIVL